MLELYRKYSFVFNSLLMILTFLVPLINEQHKVSILHVGIIAVILLGVINNILGFLLKKYENKQNQIDKQNERAKKVLSEIHALQQEKTNRLKNKTYNTNYNIDEELLFYNVHQYMQRICSSIRQVIADLINSDSEYVDVTLIYKYCDEEKWQWIAGKSGTSGAKKDLNDYMKEENTLFYHIVNNSEKRIFCNDKKKLIESNHYKSGPRDNLYKNVGSVMAMLLTFFNNNSSLVDAIVIISTYGVKFIPDEKYNLKDKKDKIEQFERVLINEVLTYYVELIQTEMGSMYLRHKYKKIRKQNNYKQDKTIFCRS